MRAVILAGGLGTRLRPYTTILPKPLVPVGDRPILEHILRRLHACGVREVDLCVGHLGELIQVYFTQANALPADLELRWHWEDEPLGTAGALRIVPGLDGTCRRRDQPEAHHPDAHKLANLSQQSDDTSARR